MTETDIYNWLESHLSLVTGIIFVFAFPFMAGFSAILDFGLVLVLSLDDFIVLFGIGTIWVVAIVLLIYAGFTLVRPKQISRWLLRNPHRTLKWLAVTFDASSLVAIVVLS